MADQTFILAGHAYPADRKNRRLRATAPHPAQHQDVPCELDNRYWTGSIAGTGEAIGRIGWQTTEISGAEQSL